MLTMRVAMIAVLLAVAQGQTTTPDPIGDKARDCSAISAIKGKLCSNDAKLVPITNGDFEADASVVQSNTNKGLQLWVRSEDAPAIPKGWKPSGLIRVAKNHRAADGGTPWSKMDKDLDSCDGNYLLVLFSSQASISQTVSNLDPNKQYVLSFVVAARQDWPGDELLTVEINGAAAAPQVVVPTAWEPLRVQFMPNSKGEAAIKIINTTPMTGRGGSPALLIDHIELREARDCGRGATCHENTRFNVGFTCVCDVQGYIGHDQTNAPAICDASDSKSPLELLNETVAILKEQVAGLSNENKRLGDALAGVKDSVGTMGTASTGMAADVKALKGSQAGLKSKLLAALAEAAVPSSSTGTSGTTPAIVADGRGVDVEIGAGQRLRVNGEEVLTSADIISTINGVLSQLADEL